MQNSVEISIIVPVYNVEDYVEKCLLSLVNQTFDNIEIVIINDGSTDSSYEICKNFIANHSDKKFVLHSQENQGPSSARNKGIELSHGKYLLFVDSDDYIHADMCKEAIEILNMHDTEMVAFKMSFLSEIIKNNNYTEEEMSYYNKKLDKSQTIKAFFTRGTDMFYIGGKIWKKSLFINNNIQFPVGKFYEDCIINLKLIENTNSAYLLNKNYYYYSINRMGSTTNTASIKIKSITHCFDDFDEMSEIVLKQCDNILSFEHKKKIIQRMIFIISALYLEYQYSAINSLLISDKFANIENIYCYGSGERGALICNAVNLNNQIKNFFFVDSNKAKSGSLFMGKQILSIDDLKEKFNKENDRLFIASSYFIEIFNNLKTLGILDNISQILPYKKETQIEQLYFNRMQSFLILNKKFISY